MFDFLGPFLFGLVGSAHCLGMCGPLILAYSLHLRTASPVPASGVLPASAAHHLAFHSGRLFTYSLLGALAGAITQIPALRDVFAGLRNGVTLGGGLLMIFFGLGLAGAFSPRSLFPPWQPGAKGLGLFRRLFLSRGFLSRLALGFLSGFLPCMLSFAMIVKAATTASYFLGFLTMFLFGLGTLPALFLTGFSASFLSVRGRLIGERTAGAMAAVMGAILVVKAGRHLLY